jgi:hypothetical protein
VHITEKCPCGASIEAEHEDHKLVQRIVDRWRKNHDHIPPATRWVPQPQYAFPQYTQPTWTVGTTTGVASQTRTTNSVQDHAPERNTTEE